MKVHDNKGVFHSPHAHIVDSFNIYQQKLPPVDHPDAIICMQCEERTWRLTDCCLHCNFDMAAYSQEQIQLDRLEQLRLEFRELRNKLLPLLISMIACATGLVIAVFLAPKTPYIYWAVMAVMLIIAVFIKPLAKKMEATRHQIQALL